VLLQLAYHARSCHTKDKRRRTIAMPPPLATLRIYADFTEE
jgi:hypothetical protein